MENHDARSLTYQALVELQSALDLAETPDDFLAHADEIVGRPENHLELSISLGTPDPLETIDGSGRDVQNAPRVYEYVGSIDLSNASDRRLWTYLAFVTYREYMEHRWPLKDVRNWKNRVKQRWLMGSATRGRLIRHGISRLWWVSALTYDEKRVHDLSRVKNDPFAYTKEAFRNEDRLNAIFDREVGALPNLARSVLEYVAQQGGRETDDHLRTLMKELTLVYGYRDISHLDARELRALIAESAPSLQLA